MINQRQTIACFNFCTTRSPVVVSFTLNHKIAMATNTGRTKMPFLYLLYYFFFLSFRYIISRFLCTKTGVLFRLEFLNIHWRVHLFLKGLCRVRCWTMIYGVCRVESMIEGWPLWKAEFRKSFISAVKGWTLYVLGSETRKNILAIRNKWAPWIHWFFPHYKCKWCIKIASIIYYQRGILIVCPI